MLLSRRYTRVGSYLFILVVILVTVHHYVVKSWLTEHRYQQQIFSQEYDIDSLLNEYKIDPNIRADDQIMVNLGLRECYHMFNTIQWCPHSKSLFNHNENNINNYNNKLKTFNIKKDVTGSQATHWFGKSLYYYYSVIEISNLVPLLIYQKDSMTLTGFKSLSIIDKNSSTQDKECLKFNQLCLEPIDLTLDVIRSPNVKIITDFTILFGEDCVDPRSDWTLLKETPLYHDGEYEFSSYISYKDQLLTDRDNNILKLHPDSQGKFKIVQLADLHMGVGKGKCIDEYPVHEENINCEADPKTITFINKVLDIERPQLVVFTGDQIMGDKSLQDSETTLLKALSPVIEREIPWALIWGNHDDEGTLSRWQLSELVAKLPFTLFEFSQFDTHDNSFGVGNYIKQVEDEKGTPLITLYFLDSHKYSKAAKISPGYDWIKEKQWEYIKHIYDVNLKNDISKVPNHLSMAFFHIPLPEYLNQQSKRNPEMTNEIVGTFKEGVTAPKYNSGGLTTLDSIGVQVTSCGHDHCNDYCLRDDSTPNNIWLCYGGSAGEGAYAGYGGTERRIRTYELDSRTGSIISWKRLNGSPEETFDYQILVNH